MYRVLAITALMLIAACERQPAAAKAPTSSNTPSQRHDKPKEPPSTDYTALLSQAATDRPYVVWDKASGVTGDFDGDGRADQAVLGHVKDGFVVLIGQSTGPGSFKRQYLPFGINAAEQAATCGPVSKFDVAPLSCSMETEEDKLPGCKESAGAVDLSVGSGDCDPINLYWDHDQGKMAWWRY